MTARMTGGWITSGGMAAQFSVRCPALLSHREDLRYIAVYSTVYSTVTVPLQYRYSTVTVRTERASALSALLRDPERDPERDGPCVGSSSESLSKLMVTFT